LGKATAIFSISKRAAHLICVIAVIDITHANENAENSQNENSENTIFKIVI
jgi:hypothetical protein